MYSVHKPVNQVYVVRLQGPGKLHHIIGVGLCVVEASDDPNGAADVDLLVQVDFVLQTVLSKIFFEQGVSKLVRMDVNITRLKPGADVSGEVLLMALIVRPRVVQSGGKENWKMLYQVTFS